MYTEDDEEVKEKSSNNEYNDFYTSFNDLEEEKSKKNGKKEKKKKEEKKEEKSKEVEDDYSNFYNSEEEEPAKEPNKNKKTIIKIIIIAILIIVVIALLIILLGINSGVKGDIELSNNSYTLNAGESDFISYKIIGTESNVISTFKSSDENVAIVDENGQITAIGKGTATITVSYTIDGKMRTKECTVTVEGPDVKHELSLELKASTTNWTNKDVTITVTTKTDTSIKSLKYAINCSDNCEYNDVENNKIVVSDQGTTKIKVVARDNGNQEKTKEVTVKIDKEAPTATLNSDSNITSKSDVSVCATCSDSLSGCKQGKVCKKFTSSASNQVITVTDNAGNSSKSESFNVTINKPAATNTPVTKTPTPKAPTPTPSTSSPCKLKVSSDGTVTATLNGTYSYYGFNSKYTGSNELSTKVSISASKKGESGAKSVYYYVKDKNGKTGSCHITVIKECKCKDANDTSANCTVSCTFRSS